MRKPAIVLVIALTGALASCGRQTKTLSSSRTGPVSPALVSEAKGFVDMMARGDFVGATSKFDVNMQAAMPAPALAQMWNNLAAQAGRYKGQADTYTAIIQAFDVVYVTCRFERASVTFRVVFNSDGEIGGLWLE